MMMTTDGMTRVYLTPCGERLYVTGDPSPFRVDTLPALLAAYEPGAGRHWFDPDTLRFFGSFGLAVVAPGVTVEGQKKAPVSSMRYKVTAWLTGEDGRPDPCGACWHDTRKRATACAVQLSASLDAGTLTRVE